MLEYRYRETHENRRWLAKYCQEGGNTIRGKSLSINEQRFFELIIREVDFEVIFFFL